MTLAGDLAVLVGAEAVLTDAGDRAVYAVDSKERGVAPKAVVLPKTVEQVQAIVRLCAQRKMAIVPRGAGTGTVGGAVPESEAIVLDCSRMNRILAVDRDNLLADVEAVVVTGEFQQAMENIGLFYPPDPASHDSSTLGGNAATNAGGLRAVKYGVTGDWIAALEVVLADGERLRLGVRTRKGVVGYDLKHLFIGSEGTLGIITGLTVRLMPKPPAKQTLLGLFADLSRAGEAVLAVLRGPVRPAAMEIMDATALAAVRSRTGDSIPPEHALLLIDVDGEPAAVAGEAIAIGEILAANGAASVRHATTEQEAKQLWSARRAISQAIYDLRPNKVGDDVTVPVSRLVDLLAGVKKIADAHHLLQASYGHAGDGNVHVNLLYDAKDADESTRVKAAREQVFRLTLELGGTLSGEHGIGIAKRAFLPWEQSSALIDLQKRLKRSFDPLNLLNPGKVFP